ncbi:unnamed protein product [Auanema sp. JU1783]|nr:unnamed protein product [Auanema sp. JU1783]
MGVLLTLGCYLVGFSPSFAMFCRFIAPDALRIILFVLGAFMWLVSLLLSSFTWLVVSMLVDSLPITVAISIAYQEAAKVFYFWILKKSQSGLNKIAHAGDRTGERNFISDLHNSRHMLALVCGLGMGVIAALCYTMNVFAEFAGSGSIGLPAALLKNSSDVNRAGEFLPLYYALSAMFLTIFHVVWVIMVWDSCHRFSTSNRWFLSGSLAVGSHYLVSGISLVNDSGYQTPALLSQLIILLACIVYCHVIMGGSVKSFVSVCSNAAMDWVSLQWVRKKICGMGTIVLDEIEAEERT